MPSGRQGSIHLFRFAGVDLFLHWSWFLIAIFEINGSTGRYSSITWNVREYLSLFLIVTFHEFGHAIACRQVGGTADHIVLWPLGGVAYVDPPPRPGATLWSIAAGPLVNVALLPLLSIASALGRSAGLAQTAPNAYTLLNSIWWINLGLLVFNMLPIYPLDGGQIFRSLLWFLIGRARSLMVATTLGFGGVAGFIIFAVWIHSLWIAVLAVFMLLNCWGGLRHAQGLARLAKMPRRDGFACPSCKTAPPLGAYWTCGQCKQAFDTFQTGAMCPVCGAAYSVTRCMDCGHSSPLSAWATPGLVAVETAPS